MSPGSPGSPVAIHTVGTEAVTEAAFEYGLNGFDAAYLALALKAGDGIATLDEQVQRAGTALGLVVFS